MGINSLKDLISKYLEHSTPQRQVDVNSRVLKISNQSNFSENTLNQFKTIVSGIEDIYPGIDKWYNKKVIPGISEGSRFAFLVMHEGDVIAETIIKPGNDNKLCSMKILPSFQNKSLGTLLFSEIAKTLNDNTEFIHFTAPESLSYEKEGLFNRLGFQCLGKSNKMYRKGEDELVFRARVTNFKRNAINLFNYHLMEKNIGNNFLPIVMSIKPEYATKIIKKNKTIEIRKKFSEKAIGSTIFLYATMPNGCVVGQAKICDVKEGQPEYIWENYSDRLGCSYDDYFLYCGNHEKIKAIILDDIIEFKNPIPWNIFCSTVNASKRPPQSYEFLKTSDFNKNSLQSHLIEDPQIHIPFAKVS